MNALLDNAQKWLTELGVRVEMTPEGLKVNRDDVDALYAPLAIYDEFLKEIREALGTNKFYWVSKDREWLVLNCF